jgi:hypothetical protein
MNAMAWKIAFISAAAGAAGFVIAFATFGRLTLSIVMAIVAVAIVSGSLMFGLSRIGRRRDA